MAVEQVTYNGPDGATMGADATELISFYGAPPIVRYPSVGPASTYIMTGQSTGTATTYGLNSADAVTSLVLQVSTITVALRNLGLIT